jgi:hypothetical protein
LNNFTKNLALWLIIGLLLIALFNLFQGSAGRSLQTNIPFSEFLSKVERSQVTEVTIQGNTITGYLTDGRQFQTYAPDNADVNDDDAVSPVDALLILNELRNSRYSDPVTRHLDLLPPDAMAFNYYDVSGDGYVTPLDALLVLHQIGLLNRQRTSSPQPQGELPMVELPMTAGTAGQPVRDRSVQTISLPVAQTPRATGFGSHLQVGPAARVVGVGLQQESEKINRSVAVHLFELLADDQIRLRDNQRIRCLRD